MSSHRKSHFKKRFVAFVDILGFSSVVERMSHDDHLFTTIRDALKDLDRQTREFQEYRRKKREKRKTTLRKGSIPLDPDSDLQMTAFSDCYVLSEIFPHGMYSPQFKPWDHGSWQREF